MTNAFHLHILPVYSALHADKKIGEVPLLAHQVRTLEAFRDPNTDVIFNTAMTGDGKSLAAYLPAFQGQRSVLAMYPTNELILDQFLALARYAQRLSIRLPRYNTMYSEQITRLVRERDETMRLEEIRKLLTYNGILLTNPDLIHLIMEYQYGWGHLRKELPITVAANFDYFLFDEFHVFGVPQVLAVVNMLNYLATLYQRKPGEGKKFLFLSATPTTLFTKLLDRSGLRYAKITGDYCSTSQPGYRCILQPCELELHEISQDASTEQWVETHLDDMLRFFQSHPDSKAAVLVYSVATARRLYARLKAYFAPYGITVGENTGLTNSEEKAASLKQHILVGTSTVDVGVDFHINYLIFEAFTSGEFLQRFGRLGRHEGFPMYRAYALLPRFVCERLHERLKTEEEVERESFNEVVRAAFPTEQQFEQYTKLWGKTQAAQVLVELQRQSKLDESQAFAEALTERYERLYGSAEQSVMQKAIKKWWRLEKQAPQITRELTSFRGQSPLSCAVWDTDDYLKTYDLFFLLTSTEFEVMGKADFLQEVKKRQLDDYDFRDQLLYLKIHEYIPERLQLVLSFPHDLGEMVQALHHIQVFSGFSIDEPRPIWRDKVNQALRALKLVCIISDMKRQELKGQLRLHPLFPVHRLYDVTGNEYSLVFGQEALLLESILFFRSVKGDKAMFL
jgi:CRISPR-associated endonuclease/helicase Cas3